MRLKICKHGDGCGYCLLHDDYCPDGPCPNEELIDYEPVKRGRWVICSDGYYPYCSECKEEPYRKNNADLPNYCPNCGAKMDLGDDDV